MSNRLDDIFAPDRLRRNWRFEDEQAKATNEIPAPLRFRGPWEEFERLRRLLRERFPGEAALALEVLTKDAEALLAARFPESGVKLPAAEELPALNLQIDELLSQIEDLVEALELGQTGA